MSIDRGRVSQRCRVMAWLGLVLIAINFATVGAMSAALAPGSARFIVAALDGRAVICTPLGMRIVEDGLGGDADRPAEGGQGGDLCVFCPPLAGMGVAPPLTAPAIFLPYVIAATVATLAQVEARRPALMDGGATLRGPPSAAK